MLRITSEKKKGKVVLTVEGTPAGPLGRHLRAVLA